MNITEILEELERNKMVFRGLLTALSKNQYRWKKSAEKWSLLEIICHLCDEEREDFRTRTKHILDKVELPLPPIDPVGWVESRDYIKQDFEAKIDEFIRERDQTLVWLRSEENADWNNFYKHPLFGKMTARMILANWLAHDYIHIRQIITLKHDYLELKFGEKLSYAGDW